MIDDGDVRILHGDCRVVMATLDACSIDVILTDPPYGLEFMGKDWDAPWRKYDSDTDIAYRSDGRTAPKFQTMRPTFKAGPAFQQWCESWALEAIRVLKPGGHIAAFGGTRTSHRLTAGLEDAGFEIRDTLCWLYGSGFPKSLDVSKAIDKAAGAEREVVGRPRALVGRDVGVHEGGQRRNGVGLDITAPGSPDAERWQGWGTALKPAYEPIVLARKPLSGTVAQTVLEHGTGALNIDGTRIGSTVETWPKSRSFTPGISSGYTEGIEKGETQATGDVPAGRWPANVILDESAARALDAQTGTALHLPGNKGGTPRDLRNFSAGERGTSNATDAMPASHPDTTTGASRFFYTAKASSADRALTTGGKSDHPTVKPLDLMRWLVRLLTPPGGLILDPFLGSGTTALAARTEGFRCIGIEQDDGYVRIAADRLSQQSLLGGAA